MEWSRRAQAGAAVLVILIALLIILYVLFLPPAERAALLGEAEPGVPGTPVEQPDNVLYATVPTIAETREPVVRDLPTMTVRTRTAGNVLSELSSVTVTRSAFHNNDQVMRVPVPPNAENLLLGFVVSHGEGDLLIFQDDVQVYAGRPARQSAPISLSVPPGAQEVQLRFSASPVGFALWDTNIYELSNVRVTADVTSYDEASQTLRFVVPDPQSLELVTLELVPECQEQQGRLEIRLNDGEIFSGRPQCRVPLTLDLAPARLDGGENSLSFTVDSGSYIIDRPAITIHHVQDNSEESFTISSEVYNRALSQERHIMMRLAFAREGAQGVILLNGEELRFRTNKQSFAAPVTAYVRPGRNTVSVVDSSADVTALEVLLQQ